MALFPPIVASSMPAFDINDEEVRIYFTLSNYNVQNKENIRAVHMTVRAQSSNKNVISGNREILQFTNFEFDSNTNRYYIILSGNDIKREELNEEGKETTGFTVNALYKVQLRFSEKVSNGTPTYNFYTTNIEFFSEWSTVCLIKPINAPIFYINEFGLQGDEKGSINNIFSNLADFVGIYDPSNSSETLKYWRLRLLNNAFSKENLSNIDDYTLSDSGIIAVSANNYTLDSTSLVLDCSLSYEFQQSGQSTDSNADSGPNYKLYFEITTKNGYSVGKLYSLTYIPQRLYDLQSEDLKAFVNEEQGYVKIQYKGAEKDYLGNLVLRRSDSNGSFYNWTDLKNFKVNGNGSFIYYDFTVQSGVFYRYLVQKRDSRGRRGTPVYCQSYDDQMGIFVEWNHPFLLESTGNNDLFQQDGDLNGTKQLKLKYDFQISSYKTNIAESKIDTLGSQYPYIRRNGDMYYRSFPITGTITGYMDEASLLTNSSEMFNGYYNYYTTLKQGINEYVNHSYDYIYERKFREKVEKFLYNKKPKLYKSVQQGNIFIKLMQVSLTPKNELGRLIYTFSATAYEIDKANLKTLDKYGLINIGEYSSVIYKQIEKIGRMSGYPKLEGQTRNLFKSGEDIIKRNQNSTKKGKTIEDNIGYNVIKDGKFVSEYSINWLRIEVDEKKSPPYLIKRENGVFVPYFSSEDLEDIIDPLYQIEEGFTLTGNEEIYLGWLFKINDQQVIISRPNTIYEIKEDNIDINITSVIPAQDIYMDIDYKITTQIETDPNSEPKKIHIYETNGQVIGTYTPNINIISSIEHKYFHTYQKDNDTIKKYCNGVKNVCIDTQPRTKVEIKTKTGSITTAIVNQTGILDFESGDSTNYITSFRVLGKRFYKDEYISLNQRQTAIAQRNISKLELPYLEYNSSNNTNYLYYLSKKYVAIPVYSKEQNGVLIGYDIACPINAMIFYLAAVRRDIY